MVEQLADKLELWMAALKAAKRAELKAESLVATSAERLVVLTVVMKAAQKVGRWVHNWAVQMAEL